MKALTISQPFASLIARGDKFVENRTWNTNHRGQLAIHAGLGSKYLSAGELRGYQTGCVLAIANLVACVTIDEIKEACDDPHKRNELIPDTNFTWKEVEEHEHTEGPYCWILEEVQRCTPVEISGKQGLWDYGRQDSLQMELNLQ